MDGSDRRALTQDRGDAPFDSLSLLENSLGKLLRDSHRAFSAALQEQLAAHDVTLSQWRHLRTLWEEDGLAQVELSRRIGIEKASSTTVLDNLEDRKLIRRLRDKADRRRSNVFLTPAGAALMRKLIPCMTIVNAAARQRLSRDELVTFFRVMESMVENLAEARQSGWSGPFPSPEEDSGR